MATTFVEYTGDGNATKQFTFPSYQESDVKVRVDGVLKTTSTHYNITSYTTTGGGNVVFTSGNIPSSPANIRIYRDTNVDVAKATYTAGSSVKAADLNNNQTQLLYRSQEEQTPNLIHSYDIDAAAIETSNVKDSAVTTAKIAADAVTNAKIADDQIDSEHYVDGSIDTQHIADAQITHVKLANDSVDGDNIQDDSINSEHYVDLSIDTQHISNTNITTAKLDNSAVTTSKIADANVTTDKIADASVTTAKIADGAITDVKLAGGALDARYYTKTLLDGGQLDNRYFTETELTSGALDGRYFTETEADARYFNISTGDTVKDGDTFPDNDTTIATTAAINDRIIDLVDDVGGFVPIANETSFPTANPDVNGGAGTIVSVSAASTNLAPSGTTVTIANGRGSGLAVIITGVSTTIPSGFGFLVETTTTDHTYAFHRLVPKATEVTTVASISGNVTTVAGISANTTTVAGISSDVTTVAGIASNVTSVANNSSNINSAVSNASNINSTVSNATNINTVAGSIANVNTTAGSIASVNTASANINSIANFGDQYQVASNNPSTDGGGNALAAGDLYFNTSANELKVYNGSAWQGGVTASGSFASTTGNTFTGDNRYNDNVKALFGTGSDLEIVHDGNNSVIQNNTGGIYIKGLAGGGNAIYMQPKNNENSAIFNPDGAVDLYYDHSKKLETANSGISVTGNITVSGTVDGRDLSADGTKLDGIASSSTANPNAIDNVVEDTSPQLGGDLDVQSSKITTSTSNGNVKLEPNGTGVVEVRGAGGADGTLQLNCSAQSHGIKLKSPPHSAAQTYTLTFPSSIVNNGFLKTDSSGNLSFAAVNTDLLNDTTPQLGGDLASNGSDILFADNDAAKFGASNDLTLSHDGSASRIQDSYGALFIGSNLIELKTANLGEIYLSCNANGAVSIRHDNVTKFTTKSDGVDITGELQCDSLDVDGSATFTGADVTFFGANYNAYWDQSESRFQIEDNAKIVFGSSQDLQIYHDGSNSVIDSNTGNLYIQSANSFFLQGSSNDNVIKYNANGAVELYYDNSKKFETTSYGSLVTGRLNTTGNISMPDNAQIHLGDSSDLQIYHDGTNSYVSHEGGNGGDLILQTGGSDDDVFIKCNDDFIVNVQNGNENAIIARNSGAVELYHDNTKRFETTSSGISVTGAVYSSTGVIGEDAANHFDFVTDNRIAVSINGSEEFRFESDGDFHADGDVIAFSNTTASDRNLKDNIEVIPNALDKVQALNGVSFTWKRDGTPSAGVIAQEVQGVLPEAVKEVTPIKGGDSHLAVNYHALTSILIESIKELKAEIEKLKGGK